ncbi:hypothetical protein INT47_005111 [Mucor saturninus]|uniref:Uncharacterized protein n=1 Tax=Mucor saturninus TaxID=64648 RepID=A0A8H7QVH1_9FUNG|nr:hypothetical protein INT47_005111 [Mucor saturninus]
MAGIYDDGGVVKRPRKVVPAKRARRDEPSSEEDSEEEEPLQNSEEESHSELERFLVEEKKKEELACFHRFYCMSQAYKKKNVHLDFQRAWQDAGIKPYLVSLWKSVGKKVNISLYYFGQGGIAFALAFSMNTFGRMTMEEFKLKLLRAQEDANLATSLQNLKMHSGFYGQFGKLTYVACDKMNVGKYLIAFWFWARLYSLKRLARIVFNECHLCLTWSDIRPAMLTSHVGHVLIQKIAGTIGAVVSNGATILGKGNRNIVSDLLSGVLDPAIQHQALQLRWVIPLLNQVPDQIIDSLDMAVFWLRHVISSTMNPASILNAGLSSTTSSPLVLHSNYILFSNQLRSQQVASELNLFSPIRSYDTNVKSAFSEFVSLLSTRRSNERSEDMFFQRYLKPMITIGITKPGGTDFVSSGKESRDGLHVD